tara:strand:+ start:4269 stop:5183 length:915 start_codon:yes stop_codon:yes gene_type:complete
MKIEKKTINICIPIYNESENLPKLINDLEDYLQSTKHNKNFVFDITFYDDGSIDESKKILSETNYNFMSAWENIGLGNALRELINFSFQENYSGLIKLDGDGQMNVKEIDNFLDIVIEENVDVIYGNRFKSNKKYKMPLFRKIGSIFFKFVLKVYSIKINDPTNGFIYLSNKFLRNSKIFGNYNAAQQILVDASLRNLYIREVSVNLNERKSGESFIGIKYPIIVMSSLLLLTLHRLTNRLLTVPGFIMIFLGFALLIYDIYLWLSRKSEVIITNEILYLLIIGGIQLVILGMIFEYFKNRNNV